MRLTWRDAVATFAAGAAVAFYLLWVTDTVVQTTRIAGVVVFALGVIACTSARAEMERIYGADGRARPAMIYIAAVSVAGVVALVTGIVALVTASEVALALLVSSIVLLWLLATLQHAFGDHSAQPLARHTQHAASRIGV